ncbi:MAG: glycosyltransferase [Planctomycetaceae bacterium]|nr:glycosyltransferase [Planctomycetaceae bacterium]
MNPVELTIVIVSHGHEEELLECVNSLPAASDGLNTEILLLDNLGRSLKDQFQAEGDSRLRVFNNQRPAGFAANINLLAGQARGQFLLILNPDTCHLSGRISSSIELLKSRSDVAIVGCKLVNPDLTFQTSYRRFPTVPVLACRAAGVDRWRYRPKFYRYLAMEDEQYTTPTPVDWVFGAYMLVERMRFLEAGGMDERFRMYYEDVDLCLRFRQRGAATVYDPSVTFVHRHARDSASQTFSQLRRWHFLSAMRYFAKHRYFFQPPSDHRREDRA